MSEKAPPLPKTLWSPMGPIRVMQCKHLPDKDDPTEDLHGTYDPKRRVIRVLKRLEGWTKWQAMRHEWVHMITYDAGLHTRFTLEDLEHYADVTATAMVAEMRNSLTSPALPVDSTL